LSGADVIILTRGGGSSEELSAFNTAEVATAVASCNTPVISAVGHETDTTLADCAADMRASTPSAAAELCAPSTDILARSADVMELRLKNAFEDCLKRRGESLSRLEMRLRSVSPDAKILNSADKLDGLEARLRAAVLRSLDANNSKLEKSAAALSALSPYNVLERGYTLTMKDGTAVTDKSQLSAGDEITVRFKDFAVTAEITGFTDV
jgi:exodeoxyribonuclease VII large subunit